jgi:MinD superfamily P-loop ATPase
MTEKCFPYLDFNACVQCMWCVYECPRDALKTDGCGNITFIVPKCNCCRACERICPEQAICMR